MRPYVFLEIVAVVGIAFLLALYCWLTGSNNPLDEDADGDRLIDHCGWVDVPNDPSRGGTVRAFKEGFGRVPSAPGSHPTGHAAFGVDGASRFDPIARGNGRAFHEGE
jgi:hypothetical protein